MIYASEISIRRNTKTGLPEPILSRRRSADGLLTAPGCRTAVSAGAVRGVKNHGEIKFHVDGSRHPDNSCELEIIEIVTFAGSVFSARAVRNLELVAPGLTAKKINDGLAGGQPTSAMLELMTRTGRLVSALPGGKVADNEAGGRVVWSPGDPSPESVQIKSIAFVRDLRDAAQLATRSGDVFSVVWGKKGLSYDDVLGAIEKAEL